MAADQVVRLNMLVPKNSDQYEPPVKGFTVVLQGGSSIAVESKTFRTFRTTAQPFPASTAIAMVFTAALEPSSKGWRMKKYHLRAHLGTWKMISPVKVSGITIDELAKVQNEAYGQKTIFIANRVKGEEEMTDGVVAILTPDMPDVLSHVLVRAKE